MFLQSDNFNADAATVTTTALIEEVDGKEQFAPDGTITIRITLTTTKTGANWKSVDFVFGEIDPALNKNIDTHTELVSLEGTVEDNSTGGTWTKNVQYNQHPVGSVAAGMYVGYGVSGATFYPCEKPFIFTFTLRLASEDKVGSCGELQFGIGKPTGNKVTFSDGTSETFNNIKPNILTLQVGKVSSDPSLKDIATGYGSEALTSVGTVASTMSIKTDCNDYTSFKIKPTATDGKVTKIQYGVGSEASTTNTATSDEEFTIQLDPSGITTVTFYTTSEDKKNNATYTLTITSTYARLSGLTADVNRPSGVAAISGLGWDSTHAFDKDDFTDYKVIVPNDYTSVDITPTILANYGTTGIDVKTTGCTAAATISSGNKLNVTGISNGASVELTVKAADTTTTKTYKIVFEVVDVDTSITSLTMTPKNSSSPITGTSTSTADYYFTLEEESDYKGTFNITTGSSSAKVKINGTAYNSSTEYGPGTYTVEVEAPFGNTKTYKVEVVRKVKAGELKPIEYSIGNGSAGSWSDVKAEANYDATSNKYTFEKSINPADYNTTTPTFFIKGTPTTDATVTPTNITAVSGQTNQWSKQLAYYTQVTFSLKAQSTEGSTIYEFKIKVAEEKNAITDIAITKSGANVDSSYSFNQSQNSYNISLPYSTDLTVDFTVTTEGYYAYTYITYPSQSQLSTTNGTTNQHTKTSVSIPVGTATVKIYAVEDQNKGTKGTEYTFNFTRTQADSDATLASLTLMVDGVPVTIFDNNVTFNSSTSAYTYSIETSYSTSASISISAVPTKETSTMTFQIGSTAATPLASSETKNDTFNHNNQNNAQIIYTITVKAQSGASKPYTITVKRVLPKGDFTDIEISEKNDSSYVSKFGDVLSNKLSISYDIATLAVGEKIYVRVTPTEGATATCSGSGIAKKTGSANEFVITAAFGTTTYTLTSTGNGSTSYTIEVILYENKDDISAIDVKNGSTSVMTDAFNAGQTDYYIEVASGVTSVTIQVTPDGTYNFIYRDSNTALTKSGSVYTATISLNTQGATVDVVIYGFANQGKGRFDTTTSTYDSANLSAVRYNFHITRKEADKSVTLDALEVSINGVQVELNPSFSSNTTVYTIEFEYTGTSSSSLPVAFSAIPTVASSKLTAKKGTSAFTLTDTGGTYKGNSTFAFTVNQIKTETYTITVRAESGDTQDYTVTIKNIYAPGEFATIEYAAPNSNSYEDLKSLATYSSVDEAYVYEVEYMIGVDNVKVNDIVNIRAIAASGTVTVTPNKTPSSNVYKFNLAKGLNTITVKALSPANEGEIFIIKITLTEASADATLASLAVKINNQTLPFDEGAFDPNWTDYTVIVPKSLASKSATIAATASDSNATITGNGITQLGLTATNNIVTRTVKVTAQNGEIMEYTITFILEDDSNPAPVLPSDTKAKIVIGEYNFEYDTESGEPIVYKIPTYSYQKNELNISVTCEDATYDIIRVFEEGNPSTLKKSINSGTSQTVSLYYGSNVFQLNINMPDGTVRKLAVVVERDKPFFTSLSSPQISALQSEYTGSKDSYSYTVGLDVDTLNLEYYFDSNLFTSDIQRSYTLKPGMNEIEIKLYDTNASRAMSDPVRTITLNIFRQQEVNEENIFWFVMFWILIALSIALLIIIFLVRRKGNKSDEPAIIYTPASAPAAPAPQQSQQPTIIIQSPNDYYNY